MPDSNKTIKLGLKLSSDKIESKIMSAMKNFETNDSKKSYVGVKIDSESRINIQNLDRLKNSKELPNKVVSSQDVKDAKNDVIVKTIPQFSIQKTQYSAARNAGMDKLTSSISKSRIDIENAALEIKKEEISSPKASNNNIKTFHKSANINDKKGKINPRNDDYDKKKKDKTNSRQLLVSDEDDDRSIDPDLLSAIDDVDPAYQLTQEQMDEDEEKIWGAKITIKSDTYFPAPTQVKRKNESGRRKKQQSYSFVQQDVEIYGDISIRDLADKMAMKANDLLKTLMKMGSTHNINDTIDVDTAELIVNECGHNFIKKSDTKILHKIQGGDENLKPSIHRTPVVTIMGHVDHGKTSLLDRIRSSEVAESEHGGITQHIGAYTVMHNDKKITFLDTPGHEAFSAMRSRGAKLTDIVILLIAADDGVKPQTVEAIEHAKKAGVPMIVAINKMDKPGVSIDNVRNELLKYEIVPEEYGGTTIFVPISAKTGMGIDNLLSSILLQAEVMDLKFDPYTNPCGIIVESKIIKGFGSVATAILSHGYAKTGDIIVCGESYCKIKMMKDDAGNVIKSIEPGLPFEIIGFESNPISGEQFIKMSSEQDARTLIQERVAKRVASQKEDVVLRGFGAINNKKIMNIIFKCDTFGSADAVKMMINKIKHDDIEIKILLSGVGLITENDINTAINTGSYVFAFNTSSETRATALARTKNIDVHSHKTIYSLFDQVVDIATKMLDPIVHLDMTGSCEIRNIFDISKVGLVYGCYITDGEFSTGSLVKIIRNGKEIAESQIVNIKRIKTDVKSVKSGYECGIQISKIDGIKEGDKMNCYQKRVEYQKIV
jgi:translation initiation factor IF-2